MAFTATISDDCKTITLAGGTAAAAVEVYKNTFLTPLSGTSINLGFSTVNLDASGNCTVTSSTLGLGTDVALEGVFKFNDGTTNPCGVVGACSIDCCLTKKMDAYITGSCTCGQCQKDLKLISEIYLLIKTAAMSVKVTPNPEFENAYIKYNKANTLCNSTGCDCNC